MKKNNIEEISKIIYGKWSNKSTLFKLIFYLVVSYFSCMEYFFDDRFNKTSILNLIILFVVILFVIIYWNISTFRIPIINNNKLKVAILINIDDEFKEDRIENIINETISDLYMHTNQDVYFVKLPINLYNENDSIKNYLNRAGNNIDTLLWLKLSSGNILDENNSYEKMTIDNLRVFSRIPIEKNIKLFSNDINLIKDIQFSNYHKNWDYLEANSIIDKKKYKANLLDIILQFTSLYYIYVGDFEKSLKYLTIVQNNKSDETINQKKNEFKNKRFNLILIDLFFKVASKYYFEVKNYKKCFEVLTKASELITEKNKLYFDLNLNLAIVSYRNNLLEKAIYHSEIIKKMRPSDCVVFLNFGFFSIIKNDSDGLYKNYKNLKLRHRKIQNVDMLEVLSFLCEEQAKFIENENKLLFDFAIGFITINYIDYTEGLKIVEDFVENYSESINANSSLLELANSCLKRKLTA